jgi:hypothetical protein
VKVAVTDNGFPQQQATFDLALEVTDANDPPHDLELSGMPVYYVAAECCVKKYHKLELKIFFLSFC